MAYILFSMYAPYPVAVNPFKSVLLVTFVRERNKAMHFASQGGVSANEQLVWVLWKILRGDGNDVRLILSLSLSLSLYVCCTDRALDWSLYSEHAGEIAFTTQAES